MYIAMTIMTAEIAARIAGMFLALEGSLSPGSDRSNRRRPEDPFAADEAVGMSASAMSVDIGGAVTVFLQNGQATNLDAQTSSISIGWWQQAH
jgi:hypothetical protein